MPWRAASPMDQRTQFIADFLRDALSLTELCALYGVARKTGYKWIDRYLRHGPAGLEERSRRPRRSPNQTSDEIVSAILAARRALLTVPDFRLDGLPECDPFHDPPAWLTLISRPPAFYRRNQRPQSPASTRHLRRGVLLSGSAARGLLIRVAVGLLRRGCWPERRAAPEHPGRA
jgi:hypothetical protein